MGQTVFVERARALRRNSSKLGVGRYGWTKQQIQKAVIEGLERRSLFSTYNVSSLSDDASNSTTLRGAIMAAQGDPQAVISFDSSLFQNGPATIALTAGPLELSSMKGASIDIQGPGDAGQVIIDAQNISGSAFIVDPSANVTLENLTITNGSGDLGGGINNAGSLTLNNVALSGNTAATSGGGIYNAGTVSINDSFLTNNTATAGYGGGIDNESQVAITGSYVADNSAGSGGGGLYNGGSIGSTANTIDATVISNNTATDGADLLNGLSTLTLTDTTFTLSPPSPTVYNGGSITLQGGSISPAVVADIDNTDAAFSNDGNPVNFPGTVFISQNADLSGFVFDSGNYQIANNTVTINSNLSIGGSVVFSDATVNINTDAGVDVDGLLSIAGSTVNIDGGSLTINADGSLNLASDCNINPTNGGVIADNGSLSVNGGALVTLATGSITTVNGAHYYSFQLARQYRNSEPMWLSSWTINWGDGSSSTYQVTNTTPTIIAGHQYASGVTNPDVRITATTTAVGNIVPMTLTLPPTLVSNAPPAPADLSATESAANSVDLSWNYDTNLDSKFLIHISGQTSNIVVPAGTFTYDVASLPANEYFTFSVTALRESDNATSTAASIVTDAPATSLSAQGPTSIGYGVVGALSISSTPSNNSGIYAFFVQWTDQNGVSLGTNDISSRNNLSSCSVDLPTPPTGTQLMFASITAYGAGGQIFALPIYIVLINADSFLSIVQQDATITAGYPTNFELHSMKNGTSNTSGWSLQFGDGTTMQLNMPPTTVTGNVSIWDVQHTFPANTSNVNYTITATANDIYGVDAAPPLVVTLEPTPSPSITVTAEAVSSTQVFVTWSPVNAADYFNGFEIVAADTNLSSQDYKVVAAADSAAGDELVTGLTPDTPYRFAVYGYNGSGSTFSGSYANASTGSPLTLTQTSNGFTATGGESTADFSWEGFNTSGGAIPLAVNSSSGLLNTTGDPALESITVVATTPGLPTDAAGAFDSVTYYITQVPTIVVTGTSGNDSFSVSDNSGAYTVNGSVTPIPLFYTLNGINLQVQGRGGNDSLEVGQGAIVSLSSDPSAGGTTLSINVAAGGICHGWTVLGDIYTTPLPSGLELPVPTAWNYWATPTTGDVFNSFPAVIGNITGAIDQATATAQPGDTIALTCEDFSSTTQFWVLGQTNSNNQDWEQAAAVSNASAGVNSSTGAAVEAVSICMPEFLPKHSVYLLYELNGSNYSRPFVINQPQIWWADSNNAYVGGKVSLFGTNLSYGVNPQPYSDQSWVYLFSQNSSGAVSTANGPAYILPVSAVAPDATGAGAIDVDPYKVDYSLSNVSAGIYQAEVYNGHGGIFGISNPIEITVAPALVPRSFTLSTAYYDSGRSNADGPLYLDSSQGTINPAAVNDAIRWASNQSNFTYVELDLPVGLVEVTDTADQIILSPNVYLVGAGNTENPTTGTVIEAAPGAGLQDVIGLSYVATISGNAWGMEIANMSLFANNGLNPYNYAYDQAGVIYDSSDVTGLTINNVTIDATTGDPAFPTIYPVPVENIEFSSASANLKFLNSTFIGPGIEVNANHATYDNCHFIGSGGSEAAQIVDYGTFVSATRCTDQGLVNNITCPGGNVDYDNGDRLLDCGETLGFVYAGNNITHGLYLSAAADSGLNGGEQLMFEPSSGYSSDVVAYQNTLSGDGAESFLDNGCGVGAAGVNIVVADNDISNLNAGVEEWSSGNDVVADSFDIYSGNSIHNVCMGFNLKMESVDLVTPQFYCNVFRDNEINGILNGTFPYAVPTAIYIQYDLQSVNPPQAIMNVFSNNIVTGVDVAIFLNDGNGNLGLGTTVIVGNFFASDGGSSSTEVQFLRTVTGSYIVLNPDNWQGFWF